MSEFKLEEHFQDPRTGETVTYIHIPKELLVTIEKYITENTGYAQNFMFLSRQLLMTFRQWNTVFDAASKVDEKMGKEVVYIREKMLLDSSWRFNIELKVMEKREPPPNIKDICEVKNNSKI